MNDEKKIFAKNTISLYAMNIVKLIFPFFTLPYLTRVLSTESYGIVTYVKSLIVYVQLILDFGFLLSATKDIVNSNNNKDKIERIIGNTIIEKIFLGIIATICYLIAMYFIPIMKIKPLFCILYLFSTLISIFILDFLYRGIEKMNMIAIPYITAKTITLILTFILVKNDSDLILIPILDFISNLISAILSMTFLKKLKFKIKFDNLTTWKKDLKDSSIYFLSNFATTIFGALTTLIAGFYISIDHIAFWGICMQILSAAKALYNPLTNSLYPYMIRKKDLNFIKKISILMMIPMIVGCLIVFLGGEYIMELIGGNKYIEASTILKLLLPCFIFSFYSMLYGWPVLGAIGRVKETSFSTVIASSFQILGLLILGSTNSFNLYNLAICCSISEFVLFFIRLLIFNKHKKDFK